MKRLLLFFIAISVPVLSSVKIDDDIHANLSKKGRLIAINDIMSELESKIFICKSTIVYFEKHEIYDDTSFILKSRLEVYEEVFNFILLHYSKENESS